MSPIVPIAGAMMSVLCLTMAVCGYLALRARREHRRRLWRMVDAMAERPAPSAEERR